MIDDLIFKVLDFRKQELERWLIKHNADPSAHQLVIYQYLGFDTYCLVPIDVEIEGTDINTAKSLYPYIMIGMENDYNR